MRTPILEDPSISPCVAVCELMKRLSIDPYPEQSPDVLAACSDCKALEARIALELRLHSLEPFACPQLHPRITSSSSAVSATNPRPLTQTPTASAKRPLSELLFALVHGPHAPTDESRARQNQISCIQSEQSISLSNPSAESACTLKSPIPVRPLVAPVSIRPKLPAPSPAPSRPLMRPDAVASELHSPTSKRPAPVAANLSAIAPAVSSDSAEDLTQSKDSNSPPSPTQSRHSSLHRRDNGRQLLKNRVHRAANLDDENARNNVPSTGPEPKRKHVGRVEISLISSDDSSEDERSNEVSDRESTDRSDVVFLSESRASATEEPPVRRSQRNCEKLTQLNTDSNSADSNASDEECETASDDCDLRSDVADDNLSTNSADADAADLSSGELKDEDDSEDEDMSISTNCGKAPCEEELAVLERNCNKFYGLLVDIRNKLTKFIRKSYKKPSKLLTPRTLIYESGLLRIRTGGVISGKPVLLIQRVLQRERHPDVVNASLRAAEYLEMSASRKAAMDAFALVCIASFARVRLDLRALEPLLEYVRVSEGNAPKLSPSLIFTDGEKYRLLRLFLLLDMCNVSFGVRLGKLSPRVAFLSASVRSVNCVSLSRLCTQLKLHFAKHRDAFESFVDALTYLDTLRQLRSERWHLRRKETLLSEKQTIADSLPQTAVTPTCSLKSSEAQ